MPLTPAKSKTSRLTQRTAADLVYVGLNSRVIAMDRYTGEIAWEWKSPEGRGYVFVLLDGDRLIVSVTGYMYCLDPIFGQLVWSNPLRGYGVGVTSLTSVNGQVSAAAAAALHQQQQQQSAAGAAVVV